MNTLEIVEYNTQRVLTTEQLASVYECKPVQIQQNFNNNVSRFTEGKHYYKLEGDNLRDFKESLGCSKISSTLKFTSQIVLWTKQGASRHCKMLGTDKAWDMFDMLEENYFVQKHDDALLVPKDYPSALRALADKFEENQKLIDENKILAPKAEFYDTVANSETLLSMADTAKILDMGVGRNTLFKILRKNGILQKGNAPYQRFVDGGYFKVVETHYMINNDTEIQKVTYVKQRGVDFIRKLLKKLGYGKEVV